MILKASQRKGAAALAAQPAPADHARARRKRRRQAGRHQFSQPGRPDRQTDYFRTEKRGNYLQGIYFYRDNECVRRTLRH